MREKSVQIPEPLFAAMVLYFDAERTDLAEYIRQGLNDKIDKQIARDYYTKYKTEPNEEEREKARQKYLDIKGIHQDYRW